MTVFRIELTIGGRTALYVSDDKQTEWPTKEDALDHIRESGIADDALRPGSRVSWRIIECEPIRRPKPAPRFPGGPLHLGRN